MSAEARQPAHEQRIARLEERMTKAEARLDVHEVVITRLDEIFKYSRNTWRIITFVGAPLGLLAAALTVASYLGWL